MNKEKLYKYFEMCKEYLIDFEDRMNLVNDESAKSWERNAAKTVINDEIYPSLKKGYKILNDLVFNYKYDPFGHPSFIDSDIAEAQKIIQEIDERLKKYGIVFSYNPPKIKD